MADNYNSIFTGQEVDNQLDRAAKAVLTSDIQTTLGEQLNKPISQKTVTEVFKKTPEWVELVPPPSLEYLTKTIFITKNQGIYKSGHIYQCLQNQSTTEYYWQDITPFGSIVESVNGKTGEVIINPVDIGSPTIAEFQSEVNSLQNQISNIKSIQILNKGVINSTQNNIQAICTNYIVTEYSREPANLDGLIITITDSVPANDKVQFVYSGFSNVWVDTGKANIDIGDATQSEKGLVQIGSGINVASGVISTNKSLVGLANVDNTSDENKPISISMRAELENKVSLQFTSANNIINYVGKNIGSLTLSNGTHIFTNCTGSVTYLGSLAKIYINNSPNLILYGKNGQNWQYVFIDGVAEYIDPLTYNYTGSLVSMANWYGNRRAGDEIIFEIKSASNPAAKVSGYYINEASCIPLLTSATTGGYFSLCNIVFDTNHVLFQVNRESQLGSTLNIIQNATISKVTVRRVLK